jgi:hypothetical protein
MSVYRDLRPDAAALLKQIQMDHEERWRLSDRSTRIMIREVTITRFMIGAILFIRVLDAFGLT